MKVTRSVEEAQHVVPEGSKLLGLAQPPARAQEGQELGNIVDKALAGCDGLLVDIHSLRQEIDRLRAEKTQITEKGYRERGLWIWNMPSQ